MLAAQIATAIICCFVLSISPVKADGPDLIGSPEVRVSTISGSGVAGIADGSPTKAEYIEPFGLAYDNLGRLYVSDAGAQRIRVVERDGSVHALAGSGDVIAGGLWVEGGYRDGAGRQARFNRPAGLAIGGDKALYVADTNNHCIRRIDGSGNVSTYAGRAGVAGHDDGLRTMATFERPTGMASDRAGNLYVADFFGIRVISPAGIVTTLPGFGRGAFGVSVVDTTSGAVIFAADESGLTRRMPDGSVERYAASGVQGGRDIQGDQLLGHPFGVAAFDDHSVAFTDVRSDTVRYLNWTAGAVQTLGGVPVEDGAASGGGYRDGSGAYARFDVPLGIATRSGNALVVADGGNKRIREISNLDRSHDALPASPSSSDADQNAYRIALVGNSFLWVHTRWADSISGIVEKSLAAASGKTRIRINPYVFPASPLEVDAQYIGLLARGGAANFYVLNINPGNLSEANDLTSAELLGSPQKWKPIVTSTLRTLNLLLKSLHAGLLVCTTPIAEEISPLETAWPKLLSSEGQTTPDTHLGAELNAAVRDSGVDMLDLFGIFAADVKSPRHEPLFGTSDVHFSYHGRAVVAHALARWFKQRQPWDTGRRRTTFDSLRAKMAPENGAIPLASPAPATGQPILAPPPSASPSASATPQFGYVVRPPQAPASDASEPQILEIDLNDQQLSAPGLLAIRVMTSTNVSNVYAHAGGRKMEIPQTTAGDFEGTEAIPTLPSVMKGRSYTLGFEAVTAEGRRITVDVLVFIKR